VDKLSAPSGWQVYGHQICYGQYRCAEQIGSVRISLSAKASTDISAVGQQGLYPGATTIGGLNKRSFGGSVFPPCSHRDVLYIADGDKTSTQLFAELASALSMLTWILRFVTYLAIWFGLYLITRPLSVAPDLVPCCGPMIGDLVGCMLTLFAMLVAACMWLSMTSLAYIVYHPILGIGMLLFACAFAGGAYVLRKRSMGSKSGMGTPFIGQPDSNYGYPQQSAYQPPVAQPFQPAYPQQQQGYPQQGQYQRY
jgi:hypothetical protein